MKQDLGLEQYMDVLKRSDMFRGIEEARLLALLTAMRARVSSFARGETIYRYGDEIREIALVLEGTVVVEASDPEGEDTNLNMLGRGDEFGAFLVISGNTKSLMHIYAGTRCAVLMFDLRWAGTSGLRTDEMWRLLNNITVSFAEKSVDLYRKVQIYGKKRIRSRIKLYLMSLDATGDELTLPMNRTELAAYLGVDRTALARELGRMRQEGIIEVDKRRVRILNREFFQHGVRSVGGVKKTAGAAGWEG